MRQFRKMVETVRRDGFFIGAEVDRRTERFFRAARICQPFVFQLVPVTVFHNISSSDLPGFESAPFPVFSMEPDKGVLYREVIGGVAPIINPDGTVDQPPGNSHYDVLCVMCVEDSPGKFTFFELSECNGELVVFEIDGSRHTGKVWEHLVRSLRNPALSVGVEKTKERIKLGAGPDKETVVVRQVVRIAPKKVRETIQPIYGRAIDWSHRWLVRGHWVRLPGGIGKDRAGNYCVPDWTWRREHEKGPEGAPLIPKTRLVSGEKNP